jgi:hypothetical protein
MHTLTFYPIGNAETVQFDLHNGKKILFDYANRRNPADANDLRINLPKAIRDNLRESGRSSFDVVAFTHLDDDHIQGMSEFFYLEHAQKYQDASRVKIDTLWVPAAAIIEKGCSDEARVVQEEAKYRLRQGKGIRVFSRPRQLEGWLTQQGLTLNSRKHLITDAGCLAPEFTTTDDGVEFFIHSPFAHRLANGTMVDRNIDALVVQAVFMYQGQTTKLVLTADLPHAALTEMIELTRSHNNDVRLEWDIIDIPHHCSYLSLADDKGKDKTDPVPTVRWLYETQAQARGILVSSSDMIPAIDTDQPPHRQAASYYRECAKAIGGEFLVTMEHPKKTAPSPLIIVIDQYKASVKRMAATAAAVVSSRPSPRAG